MPVFRNKLPVNAEEASVKKIEVVKATNKTLAQDLLGQKYKKMIMESLETTTQRHAQKIRLKVQLIC